MRSTWAPTCATAARCRGGSARQRSCSSRVNGRRTSSSANIAGLRWRAGVAETTIEAIRHGRRPDLEGDDLLVFDFVTELLRTRRVSDATYAAALARFGEQGVIDLAGLTGYYSLLAMAMNVARVPPPAGEPRLPRFPE
jgi:hypothetical protein